MNSTTAITSPGPKSCAWCGPNTFHAGICPRVKAISYHESGGIAHVEFDVTFPTPPNLDPPGTTRP